MPIGAVIGRMTVELIDNDTHTPVPRVAFDPVGRITSGWLDKHTPFLCQEIERAQARVRHGLEHQREQPIGAPVEATPARRRR